LKRKRFGGLQKKDKPKGTLIRSSVDVGFRSYEGKIVQDTCSKKSERPAFFTGIKRRYFKTKRKVKKKKFHKERRGTQINIVHATARALRVT